MASNLVIPYLANPTHFLLLTLSWLSAVWCFAQWKRTNTVPWAYLHLGLFLLPFVHFATQIQCDMEIVPAIMIMCTDYLTRIGLFMLPLVIGLTLFIGYAIFPRLYVFSHRATRAANRVYDHAAAAAAINAPLYVFDGQEPKAFTIFNRVFASVGVFDLLTRKEQEAVFLHELGHIASGANIQKLSRWILTLFSPLALFTSRHTAPEEEAADAFAARIQGTTKHLASARRKIRAYHHHLQPNQN
ncbi:M48 family metalloprotease [Candidatus Woesearchaeota archaeon]|nr:M48 family metalloprotease [Candidatus Woesearchaeota archaeon]